VTVQVVDMGCVTALGRDTETLWQALCAGRSGLAPVQRFATDAYVTHLAACMQALDAERPHSRLDTLIAMLFEDVQVPPDCHLFTASTKAGIDQLEHVVREYRIDELIFGSNDISFTVISRCMAELGPDIQYRIASHESDEIVGSDSKVSAGQMYTTRISFNIDDSLKRRAKRMFDVIVALSILAAAPIIVLFRSGQKSLRRAWKVLTGVNTWISYDRRDPDVNQLPKLKEGFIFPTLGITSAREIHTLNYIYAREYSLWKDIELFLRTGRPN